MIAFGDDGLKTRIAITTVAVALAVAHHVWPAFKPDLATLILLVIALLPWFASIIKSLELPGGFKIELQEVKAATDKITAQPTASPAPAAEVRPTSQSPQPSRESEYDQIIAVLAEIAHLDPRLALVGVRIEIEKRLRFLAEVYGVTSRERSLQAIARYLIKKGVLEWEAAEGLLELVSVGNAAAHGASIEPGSADFVLLRAPEILRALDARIEDVQNES